MCSQFISVPAAADVDAWLLSNITFRVLAEVDVEHSLPYSVSCLVEVLGICKPCILHCGLIFFSALLFSLVLLGQLELPQIL